MRLGVQSMIGGLVALMFSATGAPAAETAAADLEHFERYVRPVLATHCFKCHGPERQKSGLRLDHGSVIALGGDTGAVLEPGNPDASRLVEAVRYDNVDLQMPPKGKLDDAEIAAIEEWVRRGAPWPDEPFDEAPGKKETFDLAARRDAHWAWQPIDPASPPAVENTEWPRNDIDRYLLARLEREGLEPAPEADRRTLLRRVYLDITGLPPTPEELDAFLADDAPGAYERVVDELLQSPTYGERWGRHWLDLTRYADTFGHEQDYPTENAWRYRDYVIRALNLDVPYDELVTEHIAGDLLPNPRRHPILGYNESVIGTGFWYMHQATHAPVDVRKDQADRIDNQIDVLSKAFLGMTVACARCHDHKFDAISANDFYAMAGFLRSSRQVEKFLDPGGLIAQGAKELRADYIASRDTMAEALRRTAQHARIDDFIRAAGAVRVAGENVEDVAQANGIDGSVFGRWLEVLDRPALQEPNHPLHLVWQAMSREAPVDAAFFNKARETAHAQGARPDYTVYADFDRPDALDGWFFEGDAFASQPTSLEDWRVTDGWLQMTRPGVAHSGLFADRLRGTLRSPDFTIAHDAMHFLTAGQEAEIRVVIEGYQLRPYNGLLFESTLVNVNSGPEYVWHNQFHGLGKFKGRLAYIELRDHGDGWIAVDEIGFSNAPGDPRMDLDFVRHALDDPALDSLDALARRYAEILQSPDEFGHRLAGALHRLGAFPLGMAADALQANFAARKARGDALPEPMVALAAADGTPQDESVHLRGNYKTLGDKTPRRFLAAFDGDAPMPIDEGSGRLQLARRLFDEDNPLPARVMVNRVWKHLFGAGIVKTVDNFGVLGAQPSHPELLDRLAQQFRDDDWSLKRLIKRLVTTSAYRMASRIADDSAEMADPDNRLLHRMNRRRLEGEAIRDAILAVAGTLNDKRYGTPVPAYIAPHSEGNRRPEASGPADGDRRRSIYLEVRRNYLTPMLLAFDFPAPDTTHGRRTVSNVPAQALMLMNDPFVVEQAKAWGARVAKNTDEPDADRIRDIFRAALGRTPNEVELARIRAFMNAHPAEEAAAVWADVCHVVFTLKEFIYIG